jgi:uncharacterized protein YjiS (DUF1127 family)
MASLKTSLFQKLNAWRRYRATLRELSRLNDHELAEIGIRRCDIDDVARQPANV